MEQGFLMYIVTAGVILAAVLLFITRSDEARSRRFARQRIWVDENRRGRLPPDNELETSGPFEFVAFLAAVLLILFLLREAF
jgi:hypothetical protein